MSTQQQPTIPALRRHFTAYAIGGGGECDYVRWLEVVLVATQAHLAACEECIADMASAPGPKGREIW